MLVRRYESTKRPHPWDPTIPLVEAIEAERNALQIIKEEADMVIETSNTSVHQLRDRIEGEFAVDSDITSMSVRVVSFGYKHGLPLDVDVVMDCRFLPNPHWVEDLRPLTGRDPEVGAYLEAQAITPISSSGSMRCSIYSCPPMSAKERAICRLALAAPAVNTAVCG